MSKVLVLVGLDDDQIATLSEAIGLRTLTPQETGEAWRSIHKDDPRAELLWRTLDGDGEGG